LPGLQVFIAAKSSIKKVICNSNTYYIHDLNDQPNKKIHTTMNNQPIKYPYQELDLKELEGEDWEDIPLLGGLYRVSNFGRIKRLDIEIINCRGQIIVILQKYYAHMRAKQEIKG
jgi:hypothetical protein